MKDLHKIFALYIGCDILYKYIDEYYIVKLDMISNTNCSISHGYFDDTVFIEYQDCKLILKPLEEIKVEDLKEIKCDDTLGGWKYLFRDEFRELGYDCGYKDIPKLLETPIATTMEKAQKLIKK